MADCPHLPTTGAVYRVRLARVTTRRDEPLAEYTVCARCYESLLAVLPRERTPEERAADRDTLRRAVHITANAARLYARILRGRGADLRDVPPESITEPEYQRALRELRELALKTTYRQTDSTGRELWRCPNNRSLGPAAHLRWVVSYERRPEGQVPTVIWVGQSRPPEKWWTP